MSSTWDLPERGLCSWRVGNGDSTTIPIDIDRGLVMQVDLNHVKAAEEEDDPRYPVIDRLIEVLPKLEDGKPRLAVLGITHHDEDPCCGFKRAVTEIKVEELWLTLRSFVEAKNKEEFTEAGKDVYEETCRRRDAEIAAVAAGGRAAPGDRLRIIGYHDVLDDPDWTDFPTELVTVPGNFVADFDVEDVSNNVEFFVHTPFKDDHDGSRNSTSLGLHITLKNDDEQLRILLLGDLTYEEVEAFIEASQAENEDRLEWDILLAPHHGSRHAIFKPEGLKKLSDFVIAQSAQPEATDPKSRTRPG